MKVHQKDIIKTEALTEQLQKLEKDGRKKIEEEVEKINAKLLETYPGYTKAQILKNPDMIYEWGKKVNNLYHQREALQEKFYNDKEVLIREIENINLPYMNFFCNQILEESKRVLKQREFRILERKTDMTKDHLPVVYRIQHNWTKIFEITQKLGEAHEKIRRMRISPLSEIQKIYEKVMEIPEEFHLIDVAEGGEDLLLDFQFEPVTGLQPLYNLYTSYNFPSPVPGGLPDPRK
jgi:hypothetical protein